jgi:hypothetical protein
MNTVGQHYSDDIGIVDVFAIHLMLAHQFLQQIDNCCWFVKHCKSGQESLVSASKPVRC